MRPPRLEELPAPPEGKTGWPWTEASDPQPEFRPDGSAWPKISVVTPSFNQGQFIEETIRSVLLQSYPNLEHIIIDGGSTDNTQEIIKKYETWIKYWVSEPDRGQSHAINKGIEKSSGELFAWLNSDDLYLPRGLINIALSFMKKSNIDVVIGGCSITDKNLHEKNYKSPKYLDAQELLKGADSVGQPSVFIRRQIVQKVGNLDESLHYILDKELWIRLGLEVPASNQILCDFPVSIARDWEGNKTSTGSSKEHGFGEQVSLKERLFLLENLHVKPNLPMEIREQYHIFYSRAYYRSYLLEKKVGNNKEARLSLVKSFQIDKQSMSVVNFFLKFIKTFQIFERK